MWSDHTRSDESRGHKPRVERENLMTTQAVSGVAPATTARTGTRPTALPRQSTIVTTVTGRRWLAVARLATGFIFLWAFLDKTIGLGFATPVERAWLNGGTPAQGFLNGDAVTGPLAPLFRSFATPLADWLFQAGMLGIGAAVMLGVGLRVSAVAGSAMMLLMCLAEWSFVPNTGSTNPVVDYHVVYALALIVVAALAAGDTWGIGGWWRRLPLVQRNHWLA